MAAETINVVLAVANITADPSPAVSMVSYACDTTGGGFTVTVPDVASVTDGVQIRVTLSEGSGRVDVTTVSGADLIGTLTTQEITRTSTGITIQANAGLNKWDIIQDSRDRYASWGLITGLLANQTDLQSELDGKVAGNAAITGATKTKITYDAKGLVTAGADATTADIADSSNKRYVTDAQQTVIGNTSGTNTGDQTNISGNAATVTTNANLTGPVTSVGNATAIADAALSIAKTSGLQAALDAKAAKAISIRTYTGTTDTLVLGDAGNMVRGNNAGANTCTIPLNAVVAFPIGTQILFVQRGAGQMSIAITGGGTLNSYGVALKLVGQYAQALATKVDTDEWSIDGNLTT